MRAYCFFIACHIVGARGPVPKSGGACSPPLEYTMTEKRNLSLSFYLALPSLELPKTDEKPISSSRNQIDVTKNAFNDRRRAA